MDKLHECLLDFAEHYTDNIPEIPVIDHIPTANEFLSNYAIPNTPFAISCPENHLPAVQKWTPLLYLEQVLVDTIVTACVTPVCSTYSNFDYGRFVIPEVRTVPILTVLFNMRHNCHRSERYYVKAPNNLKEFEVIADDIRADVPWATEAFDCGPVKANLSLGNEDFFEALHKDEYHNFFYQLMGSRRFKLLPPIGHFCIPYRKYPLAQWKFDRERDMWSWEDLKDEEIEVIPEKIEPDTLEQKGFYKNIKSYVVELQPGDALYIPPLWYHEYVQSNDCFTLNYWYYVDKWELKFPLLRFLGKLCKAKNYKDASVDTQTELEASLIEDMFNEVVGKPHHRISKEASLKNFYEQ